MSAITPESLSNSGSVPEVPPSEESESETSATWLERLRAIDYADHKKAAVVIGAAAVAVGVGAYFALGNRRILVASGDRYMEKKGLISILEVKEHGVAISAPTNESVLDALEQEDSETKMFFAMTGKNIWYPLNKRPEDINGYKEAARVAAGWLIHRFSAGASKDSKTD